jgi:hypothetical protein
MILSYHNLGEKKRHRIKAEITTEHPAASCGQPVIVLEDGNVVDLFSWTALGYKVISATKREMAELARRR